MVIQEGVITHLFNGARGPGGSKFNGGNTFNMVTEICAHGPATGGIANCNINANLCWNFRLQLQR